MKGIDTCLACHHAVLIIRAKGPHSPPMASRSTYMMPRAFGINLRGSPWHSSQIMEEIELSERGQRAPKTKRNSGGKMIRPRCAKPRTPNPNNRRLGANPCRMKSKADASKQAASGKVARLPSVRGSLCSVSRAPVLLSNHFSFVAETLP